jgi:hypothetical protein
MSLGALLLALCSAAWAGEPAFIVDPRVELLAVAHSLAGETSPLRGFRWNGLQYSRQARARFSRFKDHPAVLLYRKRAQAGLGYADAFKLVLHAGSPPGLAPAAGAAADDRELLAALSSFATDSGFMSFYRDNAKTYAGFVSSAKRQAAGRDWIGLIERYSGVPVSASYSVVVCPLCDEPEAMNLHDPGAVYSSLGPSRFDKGRPVFDYLEFRLGMWHELGHEMLDPLADQNQSRIDGMKGLFTSVAACCRGSWGNCVREHAAIGLAFAVWDWSRRTGRVSEGPKTLKENKKPPFIDAVVARYREFEAERGKPTTLAEFYPRLLDAFAELEKTHRGAAPSSACGPGTDF